MALTTKVESDLIPLDDLVALDEVLTDEEKRVRDAVRRFLAEQYTPHVDEWFEKEIFPRELVPKIAELGVLGMNIDGYDCAGFGEVAYGLATVRIASLHGGVEIAEALRERGYGVTEMAGFGREGLRFNSILPGWIATEPMKPLMDWKVFHDTIVHRTPARRFGTPDDVAGACVYLASDAARFHTGDTLRVDGGYSVF